MSGHEREQITQILYGTTDSVWAQEMYTTRYIHLYSTMDYVLYLLGTHYFNGSKT